MAGTTARRPRRPCRRRSIRSRCLDAARRVRASARRPRSAGPGSGLGFYDVRDLLFHLPRRYDDLREMQQLGDLVWVEDGDGRRRPASASRDVRVEPTFRRRVQRTIAILEDETGSIEATWFGRRFIERRLHAGRRGHRVAASSSTSAGS